MTRWVVVLVAFAVSGCSVPMRIEQGGIKAKVVSVDSATPIAVARIYCEQNPKVVAVSDSAGVFEIPEWVHWQVLPYGADAACEPCDLVITASGYEKLSQRVSCIDKQIIGVYRMRSGSQ